MPISIAGSGTITGISAGGLPDDCITTADIAAGAVTQAKRSEQLTLGTAVASTSGTSIDFTGIPSWVKRVTVMFDGVSTSGSSNMIYRLGSGSIDTSANYSYSRSQNQNGVAPALGQDTTATYCDILGIWTSAQISTGHLVLTNITANTWISTSNLQGVSGATAMSLSTGKKTLSGTLDRIRISTVNGTDTFDAGSINIMYE